MKKGGYGIQVLGEEHIILDIVSEVPLAIDTSGLNGEIEVMVGEQVVTLLLGKRLMELEGSIPSLQVIKYKIGVESDASEN